jgi:nucleotide-binding universal stress UspA family protein
MKILLAIDGSSCSDAAVNAVAQRPWPAGSKLRIISAYDVGIPPTPEAWAVPPNYFDEIATALRGNALSIVEAAAWKLRAARTDDLTITTDVVEGSPKRVIVDEAAAWNADLIVVGSHGYGAVARFLLGSVSNAVASHAKCSVEIVRCADAGDSKTS